MAQSYSEFLDPPKPTTEELYDRTIEALENQRWGQVRQGLDDLAQSSNNREIPKRAEGYGLPKDNPYYDIIQDRIEQANACARRYARGW